MINKSIDIHEYTGNEKLKNNNWIRHPEPYMKTPSLTLLRDNFRNYPHIQEVYFFDSRAGGENIHRESDLDLTIVPKTSSPRNFKLDILTDLARMDFENVDLVFLDTTDNVLKFEAVRHNQVL